MCLLHLRPGVSCSSETWRVLFTRGPLVSSVWGLVCPIHPRPAVSYISETWRVLFIRDLMCLIRLRSGVPYPPPYRLIHRPPVQIAPSGCADCPTRPCGLCGSCRSGSCLERPTLCRSCRLCGLSRLSSCFKSSREGSSNRND